MFQLLPKHRFGDDLAAATPDVDLNAKNTIRRLLQRIEPDEFCGI